MSDVLAPLPLPEGVRSRFVDNRHGLRVHFLEAGFQGTGRPVVLLLHGFPELAYSWRKVMLPLAQAGFHVIAPDQRGYGRTTGWDGEYDGDVASFRLANLATDALGLLAALGLDSVVAVIGHDFGSPVAACCALARPDVFRSVVLMSAPFAGAPALQPPPAPGVDLHAALAQLPRPRKHYQWYYSTREAAADMHHAPQGLHDFLRAYYHVKSADWSGNRPFALSERSAAEFAKLPDYYVMDRHKTMAGTVAPQMPTAAQIAACKWLTDDELAVYTAEFARTGLQGGLQWYRCATEGINADLQIFAGRTIDVPACFIAGRSDWGARQAPGALEAMQTGASCTQLRGCHFVDGAGHWVQQEQPEAVLHLLLQFLREN